MELKNTLENPRQLVINRRQFQAIEQAVLTRKIKTWARDIKAKFPLETANFEDVDVESQIEQTIQLARRYRIRSENYIEIFVDLNYKNRWYGCIDDPEVVKILNSKDLSTKEKFNALI